MRGRIECVRHCNCVFFITAKVKLFANKFPLLSVQKASFSISTESVLIILLISFCILNEKIQLEIQRLLWDKPIIFTWMSRKNLNVLRAPEPETIWEPLENSLYLTDVTQKWARNITHFVMLKNRVTLSIKTVF